MGGEEEGKGSDGRGRVRDRPQIFRPRTAFTVLPFVNI